MNVLAFILAVGAVVCFLAEFVRSRSLVAAGLGLLALAWIVVSVWVSTHAVSFT